MSDAYAFEHPAASTISESFTRSSRGSTSLRNHSGSCTVPGFACSHSASARIVRTCDRSGVLGSVAEGSPSVRSVRTRWDGEVRSGETVATGSR